MNGQYIGAGTGLFIRPSFSTLKNWNSRTLHAKAIKPPGLALGNIHWLQPRNKMKINDLTIFVLALFMLIVVIKA